MTFIAPVTDPLDLIIEPNTDPVVRVRDLATRAECASAVMKIENDMAVIRSQIAEAEASPGSRPDGWRSRAQNALTWKRRVRKAIVAYAEMLPGNPAIPETQQSAILRTIKGHLGSVRFDELVEIAKRQFPELWEGER